MSFASNDEQGELIRLVRTPFLTLLYSPESPNTQMLHPNDSWAKPKAPVCRTSSGSSHRYVEGWHFRKQLASPAPGNPLADGIRTRAWSSAEYLQRWQMACCSLPSWGRVLWFPGGLGPGEWSHVDFDRLLGGLWGPIYIAGCLSSGLGLVIVTFSFDRMVYAFVGGSLLLIFRSAKNTNQIVGR